MNADSRFTIIRSVGRDELGEVSEAIENASGQLAALKVFDAWTMASDVGRAAYREALQKLHAIGPARTPRAMALHLSKDSGWLATDWILSSSLETYIQRVDGMNPEIAAAVACGILDALQELHDAGHAHGGLSPGKVMLTQGFAAGGVVITDPFQHHLYSVLDPRTAAFTATAPFFGYAKYLSPEQAQGGAPDVRSDIYVIGLLLYEMIAGAPAFAGASPAETLQRQISGEHSPIRAIKPNVTLSSDLEEIINVALAKDPNQRFQSPIAMRRALAHCRTSGDEDVERNAAPLGRGRGADIRDLFITKVEDLSATHRAEAERQEREAVAAAATAAATAAAAAKARADEDAKTRAADDAAAAARNAAAAAGAADAAARDAAAANAERQARETAAAQAAAAAATGQGKKSKKSGNKSGANVSHVAQDTTTVTWFSEGQDGARMSEMHSDGDVPTLTEINRSFKRTSRWILIAALVFLMAIAVAAIKLGPATAKADDSASVELPAPAATQPSTEG